MIVTLAAVVGFLTGRLLWLTLKKTWQQDALLRVNYNGVTVPTAAGIVLSLSLLIVEGLRAIFSISGIAEEGLTPARAAALVLVMTFTVLGLLDDLASGKGPKGFAGHLRALARGQLTSGGLKVVGGIAAAIAATAFLGNEGIGSMLIDVGIIALAANFLNLLDLRPGRATKCGLLIFAGIGIASSMNADLVPVAIVVGAAAALLLDDLHERLMLGDTGANTMGAALGLGLVLTTEGTGAIVVLVALAALNLLSEVVSFTKIIERTPPLRAADRLGRPRQKSVDVRDTKTRPPSNPFDEPQASRRERATVGSRHVASTTGSTSLRDERPSDSGRSAGASTPSVAETRGGDLFSSDIDLRSDESDRNGPQIRRQGTDPGDDGDDERPGRPF